MLTREQVAFHAGQIKYGHADGIRDHADVLLAHDAEQRQTIELEQQKVAAACEVIAHHKQTIEAQAQRITELEASLIAKQARIEELVEELERHAWKISPAMAQAKLDEQAQRIAELEAALERHQEEP